MICDNTNRVLVQDKVHSRWSGITFPGGHIDDGESIYESIIREVREETGLTVSNLKSAGMIHMYNRKAKKDGSFFSIKLRALTAK
ncbi:MAG: NUDIX domain-containing protein [Oscillospiraceae bacterium]|nr:NUDIX domain-containing protein [Oscillospiraceae bacterium]